MKYSGKGHLNVGEEGWTNEARGERLGAGAGPCSAGWPGKQEVPQALQDSLSSFPFPKPYLCNPSYKPTTADPLLSPGAGVRRLQLLEVQEMSCLPKQLSVPLLTQKWRIPSLPGPRGQGSHQGPPD